MQTSVIDLHEADDIVRSIKEKYVDSGGLKYGWKSNKDKSYDFGHWNKTLLTNSKHHYYDHSVMPYINKHSEIKLLWEMIQSKIGKRCLLRAYINGYTFGTDAYYHVDDIWIKQQHGDVLSETIIVYLNDEWNKDWGGETSIINEHEEIEYSVLPKRNRVLVFDSNKFHSARPLSRICPELRSVLVFKTIDFKCLSPEVKFIHDLGADEKHSGKSFFEHLYNVSMLLEMFEQRKEVCSAGLFHSVYGTEFYSYSNSKTVERETVKELIGEYAESLVYEFCNLENRLETIINNSKNYSESFRKDMLFLEYANLIEQNNRRAYDRQIEELHNEILKLEKNGATND
jgi:hypothetical protein